MPVLELLGGGATMGGMAARMEKLSVSIDAREVIWARKQAKVLGTSLSAVLTDALKRQRKLDAMDRLLTGLGVDDITEEELLAVHAERVG